MAHHDVLEQTGVHDFCDGLGQLTGAPLSFADISTFSEGVVDVSNVGEERISADRKHMLRAPEGQVAPGAELNPGEWVPRRRVEPVPRCGGEDQIKPAGSRRPPSLERAVHDLDVGERGEVSPGGGSQFRADLDPSDVKAAAGQRQGGLAGCEPDLQYCAIGVDACRLEKGVEQFRRILRSGLLYLSATESKISAGCGSFDRVISRSSPLT